MIEHFRGVVWPRGSEDGMHRYVIVGVLLTDKPIAALSGNEIVLDGLAFGLSGSISDIRQRKLIDRRLGTADDVLLTMADWVLRNE